MYKGLCLWLLMVTGVFIPVKAQPPGGNNSHFQHQVSLNGSASTWGILFRSGGSLNIKSDTFTYKGYAFPAIQLGYDFYIKNKISVGILLSTQKMGMHVDQMIFENDNGQLRRFNGFDVTVKRRYYGFKIHYHFIRNPNHDFYAGVRYGGVFWNVVPEITDTDLDKKLNTRFTGTFFPAVGIGYRYIIRERIGVGLETGIGIPQIFSYGLDYRF